MILKYFHTALLALAMGLLLTGCHSKMAPTITAGRYNEQHNTTDYTVSPYGSVALPGKWTHGRYQKESRQQYFYNSDSTVVSVAFGPCTKFSFASPGVMGYDFVQQYYKWESRYQQEILHNKVTVVAEDKAARYMLWHVQGADMDMFFLCGARDCACSECAFQNYTIRKGPLTDEQKVKFLKDVFLEQK